ncbi:circularly permuted type 2 ATP-grasp protein [Luteococcus peritonei]|uniref:Circularly permuted type 2 ATP-grasp protein n=1 Tax=Luteococcus peritonei TaxID=88874 RepID=A0ABW4RVV9_9ACTN
MTSPTSQPSPAPGLVGVPTGDLAATIERLGPATLACRRRQVQAMVREDGISYGGQSDERQPSPWKLDPLPLVVEASTWAGLEKALEQRARLMDALYVDLYGRRRTIVERLLPAELVLGHEGFLPAADQVRLPSKRQLVLSATDLVQQGDGSWLVMGDRVQAPSGAGYAMANRRVIARAMGPLHRRTRLRRLRGFFDVVQAALQQTAPPLSGEVPHVVLLTPGPGSESAYDQAMLSTLLGYPLAQSDDLVMRGGRVWMRTTGRLASVDVVLRRVDADWCDSLDLRPESRLGVPGMAAASARGSLSVVNPLGAGVLENPGLVPYLEQVSRSLLGESLLVPGPATWWCGEPSSASHVLANLEHLVIKPISRGLGQRAILGWELDAAGAEQLRARITAEPWRWSAQEQVSPSTAPVVTEDGLEERTLVLRGFTAAIGGDVVVMPGALARLAGARDELVVTSASGALSKDVWVLDGDQLAPNLLEHPLVARARVAVAADPAPDLTPRAASNLYWMGRYAERTEQLARLVLVADNLVEDHHLRTGTPGHQAMARVVHAAAVAADQQPGAEEHPFEVLATLLLDPVAPGSAARSARQLDRAAGEVREMLSLDTPIILAGLQATLSAAQEEGEQVRLQHTASRVLESCLALAGLGAESLVHDAIWAFLDAGRRVERAQGTVRLLRNTLAVGGPPVAEAQVVESLLRAGESLLTYRRRMAAGAGPAQPVVAACHLLLTDETNPRSVVNQLERLLLALAHAPEVRVQSAARALVQRLRQLDLDELCAGDREALRGELAGLETALRELNDLLEATHFASQKPPTSFAVPELGEEER